MKACLARAQAPCLTRASTQRFGLRAKLKAEAEARGEKYEEEEEEEEEDDEEDDDDDDEEEEEGASSVALHGGSSSGFPRLSDADSEQVLSLVKALLPPPLLTAVVLALRAGGEQVG